MKLSLSWVFDHIEADWKDQDIDLIVSKFNAIVAEIEHVSRFKIDLSAFYLARQESQSGEEINLFVPELSHMVTLPKRTCDIVCSSITNPVFMIRKNGQSFYWAMLSDFLGSDFSGEKKGLMPAFDFTHNINVDWRSFFETEDVILEVDNKSLNHRPDMWGHRGFAREISAFLDLPFLHDDDFLKKHPVLYSPNISSKTNTTPIVIENKADTICQRFAGVYIRSIENKASNLAIASRLLRVGLRPINLLVDLSNYIACDWSQPVHVYDADKIENKHVVIRMAHTGEKLDLLDGQSIELDSSDLVIASAEKPMCLAGIKGGSYSSVNAQTKAIFFEAANFDAGTVRRSSVRHKLRTDSSARFEKTLDPNQAIDSIFRFLKLLQDCSIEASISDEIIAVGIPPVSELVIEVGHEFLEQKIGVALSKDDITKSLTKLGFKILDNINQVYHVSVPTYRSSKDIKIKEDILEEVARCYGFGNIPHVLPCILRPPYDTQAMMRERKLKHFLAYSAKMTEFQNYAFFNEENLLSLGFNDIEAISLINPVSENYRRLVTSLIPGLMTNIKENQVHSDSLPVFEWGKIWPHIAHNNNEQYSLAGIFFERRNNVDFYACKDLLQGLFRFLDLDEKKISWQKIEHATAPWYNAYQTAKIMYGDQLLGYAGMMEQSFLSKIDALPESDAFVFELYGELLRSLPQVVKRYEPISRYQDTYFDVSLMVPLTLTVTQLTEHFWGVNSLIKKIELLDFFEKKEWSEQRSLTFRLWLSDHDKTLEKHEIDSVWKCVVDVAASLGAQLRIVEQS